MVASMVSTVEAQDYKPELVVQHGHSSAIWSLDFSPDGKLLISGSSNGEARLWEAPTGLLLRAFSSKLENCTARFVLQGRLIELENDTSNFLGKTIRLVDTATGLDLFGKRFSQVIMSPSNDVLLVSHSGDESNEGEVAVDTSNPPKGEEIDPFELVFLGESKQFVHLPITLTPGGEASFSRDGKLLFDFTRGKGIAVYSVATRSRIRGVPYDLVDTFGDDQIIVTDKDKNAFGLVDARSGDIIRAFNGEYIGVTSEQKILFKSSSNLISQWDGKSQSPEMLADLHATIPTNAKYISFTNSPDGKYLAAKYEIETAKGDDVTSKAFVLLFDVAKNVIVQTYEFGAIEETSFRFSPDGSRLIIKKPAPKPEGRSDVEIIESRTGRILKAFTAVSQGQIVIAFDGDKVMAIGDDGGGIKVWDLRENQQLLEIRSSLVSRLHFYGQAEGKFGAADGDRFLDFGTGLDPAGFEDEIEGRSPDKKFRVRNYGGGLKLNDAKTGSLLKAFPGYSSYKFSSNGKFVAVASQTRTSLWKLSPLTLIGQFRGQNMDFSPDCRTFYYVGRPGLGGMGQLLHLVNTTTGRETWKLDCDEWYCDPSFSPDSKLLALGSGNRAASVTIYDATTHKPRVGPDADEDNDIDGYGGNDALFSNNGRLIAIGGTGRRNGTALFEVGNWTFLDEFLETATATWPVAFLSNDRILVTENTNDELVFWSIENNSRIATAVVLSGGDWLVTTADGLFDGTPGAWKQLMWRFENDTFSHAPVEAFFKEFYHPGLLQEILQGEKPQPPAKDLSKVDIRQPRVEISMIDGRPPNIQAGGALDNQTAKVRITITDNDGKPSQATFPATSGARDLRLFRNGSLVKIWHNDIFQLSEKDGCKHIPAGKDSPQKAICETDIQIGTDENRFSAYAFNHDNVKSNDSATVVANGAASPKHAGVLYILAIGINRYDSQNQEHDLKFAVDDVREIADEVQKRQSMLNQYSKTEITKLSDEQATKTNIQTALNRLADDSFTLPSDLTDEVRGELQKIHRLRPEDALLIYYSGHGTAQGDRFYLIPHDGFPKDSSEKTARIEMLKRQSISDLELETALENVQAGQILMVLDTCNSGAIEGEEKRRGPMNSRGLAQLAYEKGMFILTASRSYQSATEAARIGNRTVNHGLLTFALLDALDSSTADKNRNGAVSESEWFSYAVDKVPQFQKEAATNNKGAGYGAATVDSAQTPRLFFRRELNREPFIVFKSVISVQRSRGR